MLIKLNMTTAKVATPADKDSVIAMINESCISAPDGTLPLDNYLAVVDPVLNNTDFGFFVLAND